MQIQVLMIGVHIYGLYICIGIFAFICLILHFISFTVLYETLPRNEDNNVRGKGYKKEYGYYLGTDDPNTINARLNLCSIDYKEENSSLLIRRQYETIYTFHA